ncbi:hypothetical protein CJ469_04781 [Nocardia farcinica]|nr:hypothetical protein CJ469_04781 [Nocardia farcinica]PFX06411.1 hypothetical protein CJ468_04654 [Nocardia farcinica]
MTAVHPTDRSSARACPLSSTTGSAPAIPSTSSRTTGIAARVGVGEAKDQSCGLTATGGIACQCASTAGSCNSIQAITSE